MYYKKTILSYKASSAVRETLESLGIEVISTVEHKNISREICDHADMQIAKINEDLFVCAPEVYEYYKPILGEKLICGSTSLKCNYPYDVAYNIARVGGYAFHNIKYTDLCVLNYLKNQGVKIINVCQGYTKCNMCIAGNSVITSDEDIYQKCVSLGIRALKIRPGHIILDGYDYGFIGGASGQISDDTIFFAGDISSHPDFVEIKDFLSDVNVKFISVPNIPLIDIGTVTGFGI